MTKGKCVSPKKMLDSPEKAICLYLLKKETKKKNRKRSREAGELLGVEGLETVFSKKMGLTEIVRGNQYGIIPFQYVTTDHTNRSAGGIICRKIVMHWFWKKLSKAYGKADQLEKLKERLADWIEKGYTDQNMAEMLYMRVQKY